MPYNINKSTRGYTVSNVKTGKKKAKNTTKANAEAQVRLLQGIKHNPKFAAKVRRRARRKSDDGMMYI